MEILYDPDDVPRSPELETSKIDYRPKDSPPPFLDVSERDAKKGADEGTSQDCSHQNRPDIAEFEREHPLSENFRPEDGFDSPKKHQLKPAPLMPTDETPKHPSDLNEKAQSALELLLHKEPSKPDECAPVPASPVAKPSESPSTNKLFKHFTPTDDRDLIKREPDTSQTCQTEIPLNLPTQENKLTLERFVIPASEAPAHDLLPALHSPDKNHTLPSLQTALGQTALALPSVSKDPIRPAGSSSFSLPPVTATSPPGLRSELAWEQQRAPKFGPQVHPPSPYSHWSPASTAAGNLSAVSSPASQNWRPLKSEISYLTSHSPYDLHPAAKSPATGYPTPTDQTPGSTCDRTPFNPSTQPNGAAGSTGAFKCSWPGCTAPPFQTQYLLNSHANVHSQDRPHFCSIEGCPRGPGGKGFKRKNEMIRHGLVHNSPGYVCPFCPDQQHKYPRPDNLQRHVRVHHVDKSKDDPALRQVLSQRPEGSVRGRRRRQSVQ